MPPVAAKRMLGKLPPKQDPRTLRLLRYAPKALPPYPAAYQWGKSITNWQMLGNDQYGDCTCACLGHQIELWNTERGAPYTPAVADVLAVYSAVTAQEGAAFNPVTGANDNGAFLLDVLNYVKSTGMGGHTIEGFMQVSSGSIRETSLGIYLFGALACGFNLPLSAQSQTEWGLPAGGLTGDGAAGSWGGHAVPLVSYDADGVTCVTWGALQKMSWEFFATYSDEAYAVLSGDWADPASKKAPNGFDFDLLEQDLDAITGS